MIPPILRLDVTGAPTAWIPWQEAVVLYVKERVTWTAGNIIYRVRGGISRLTGQQSHLELSSIIACKGKVVRHKYDLIPPLNNRELFHRDHYICLYCMGAFRDSQLTRDHIIPRCQGGDDSWTNVVTACRSCNQKKDGRTPEEAGMTLLAVPYVPNYAEWLVLKNRRILEDQMEFLKTRFRRHGERLSFS
ncbi:HNH endonuclease [Nitrosococcus watsonii]|uniref:HNH endonuclease n=1 Tax=Nitrosococcus watsoni (strain C-113) TaxID=105559 RepID=D8K5A3_NITWC|nr:HNH endonuclease [Nitrosococcus watsonii]ADJ28080.1 HNH endonuclease [Nitrosococcus watsonii C-113]